MRMLILCAALALVGCGDDSAPAPKDMAAAQDLSSLCGHPGDVGNSLGVGKYCQRPSDCATNAKAFLCSTLGSSDTFFCTMTCSMQTTGDMGSTECGENATCQCQGGQCGCFPNACR